MRNILSAAYLLGIAVVVVILIAGMRGCSPAPDYKPIPPAKIEYSADEKVRRMEQDLRSRIDRTRLELQVSMQWNIRMAYHAWSHDDTVGYDYYYQAVQELHELQKWMDVTEAKAIFDEIRRIELLEYRKSERHLILAFETAYSDLIGR